MFEKPSEHPKLYQLYGKIHGFKEIIMNEGRSMLAQRQALIESNDYDTKKGWKVLDLTKPESYANAPFTFDIVRELREEGLIKGAMFSVLDADSFIPPHTEKSRVMRFHLVCESPSQDENQLGIRAGSEILPFIEGCVLMFKDSVEHEVWNRTDKPRVNLVLDVIDPDFVEAPKT
ncbi:aspartyl/asparaginyl beta-hydroxylase domain-containing protein [Methylobacillus sp.]|uniref:aspartyl/asparaginyl beta-hydroxylase domain-containing protein n=1 Tax=Methylobacillus sp. TaxID=56818 RepID=UPI0012CD5D4F|nr:aspartyl/asparaginyl beta-hydroxylase domain-containing protein [Methylobacillus sp.]MPS48501.1 aspartyl/asparaginyl beta-hydroxylase domain-containing protein [Methylobacillus sp.]